jgi:tetratricopeptide (TPR) repeat protein
MIGRGFVAVLAAVFTFCLPGLAMDANAQSNARGVLTTPGDISNLRAKQSALFAELLERPDDLDLMFEYATLSIELEDYEAAISTLERMLIYRQDLSRVRLELAVAYFNLGSYEASELYFDQVLADPSTPDIVRARIARFKEAIANRTRTNAFTGTASVGITYSTNATLGPDEEQILFLSQLVNLDDGNEEEDFGMRVIVSLSHLYDLQQEDSDFWRTDFSAFSLRHFSTENGDVAFGRIRTGPRLSLNSEQFGPKLRPYVEAQYLNSQDRGLFAAFGTGFEYSNTLTPILSSFGDFGIRYRNFFRSEFTDDDSYNAYAALGLAYIPSSDLVFRGTTLFDLDAADADENSNVEVGLRLSGEYQYDSGIEWIDRKWAVSMFGEVRTRFFREPDPLLGVNRKRQDWDLRAGLSHTFALQKGFGVQVDVDGLYRDSNIFNFDLDNISSTVSLQYRF